jgi:hypothetical protein
MTRYTLSCTAFLAALPVFVLAQAPQPVTKSLEPIKETVTIQAIDTTTRAVTIRDSSGDEDILFAPPEVKRFNELKVGQQLAITYYESLVFAVAPAGKKAQGLADSSGITPRAGALPGGTVTRQITATVEVAAVDMTTPSITIKTKDGRTITRKVDNVKNITGVKAGDSIDITYTQAALLSVEPGPAK